MQLARYKALVKDILGDDHLKDLTLSTVVYRHGDGGWSDSNEAHVGPNLCAELSQVLSKKEHWRRTNSKTAMFPIVEAHAVVSAEFASSPSKITRETFQKRLNATLRDSNHAFDAKHDAMTGLLNARAFSDAIRTCLETQNSLANATVSKVNSISPPVALAVLALDIDFFKQVNDTFGHPFGDVVIRTVALRLHRTASNFCQAAKPAVEAFVSRPSGEEFLILLAGPFGLGACHELAESLRRAVAEAPIPTEEELRADDLKQMAARTKLPAAAERRTSVSIGFTIMPALAHLTPEVAEGRMRQQADSALYRAKIGGRNTVRYFDDILLKYGTVIEHHEDTDVVCVDLGKDLGCSVGREFLVYHPTFTGVVPFVVNDGRTSKTLGRYPRIPMGRIVVIDSQPDISFCEVRKKECPARFPSGSLLEAVPLGSISHLLSARLGAGAFASIGSQDDVRTTVADLTQKATDHLVLVARIRDEESVLEQRGTGFMNDLLASLYESLRGIAALRSPGVSVNQISQTEFALVLPSVSVATLQPGLDSAFTKTSAMFDYGVKFVAGAFRLKECQPAGLYGDKSSLLPQRGLDYARYAAALAATRDPGFELFTPAVAAALLQQSRAQRKLEHAVKDYGDFRELGIANADLENTMACLLFEVGGDAKLMDEASRRAVEIAPKGSYYHANRGVFLFQAGNKAAVFDCFKTARKTNLKFTLPTECLPTEALGAFESWTLDKSTVAKIQLLNLPNSAKAHCNKSFNRIDPTELDAALAVVSTAT